MAVSLSLMFEGGGQPISSAGGFLFEPIQGGLPDLPTNALYAYGYIEGIPRLLDLMDKHDIKLSSFMIGRAVENQPDVAREIVRRGHEADAHGRTWKTVHPSRPIRSGNSSPTASTRFNASPASSRSDGMPTTCGTPCTRWRFCRT